MAGPLLLIYTPCSFTTATGPFFFPDVSAFLDFLFLFVNDVYQYPQLTGERKSLISKVEKQTWTSNLQRTPQVSRGIYLSWDLERIQDDGSRGSLPFPRGGSSCLSGASEVVEKGKLWALQDQRKLFLTKQSCLNILGLFNPFAPKSTFHHSKCPRWCTLHGFMVD